MKNILSVLFLILGITTLPAGDVASHADARILAKQSNKPILVYFWSDN